MVVAVAIGFDFVMLLFAMTCFVCCFVGCGFVCCFVGCGFVWCGSNVFIFVVMVVDFCASLVWVNCVRVVVRLDEVVRHMDDVRSAKERDCRGAPSGLLQMADYFKRVLMVLMVVFVCQLNHVMWDEDWHRVGARVATLLHATLSHVFLHVVYLRHRMLHHLPDHISDLTMLQRVVALDLDGLPAIAFMEFFADMVTTLVDLLLGVMIVNEVVEACGKRWLRSSHLFRVNLVVIFYR